MATRVYIGTHERSYRDLTKHEHTLINKMRNHIVFNDFCSDMDMSWDETTGDYTLFAVEYEGMYGKCWYLFDTEIDRENFINDREYEMYLEAKEAQEVLIRKGQEKLAYKRQCDYARSIAGRIPEDVLRKLKNVA